MQEQTGKKRSQIKIAKLILHTICDRIRDVVK